MPGKIAGTVVAFTDAGSLVTDIPHDRLQAAPRDESVAVTCDEHETVGIFPADHRQPNFTFLAMLGPSGFLELHIVGESAQAMLGVRIGDRVTVKW